jgi:hypothetical protein
MADEMILAWWREKKITLEIRSRMKRHGGLMFQNGT